MKKQLLLFAMILLPLVASAHDFEVKNADGVTIYYNYINDGTELEVSFRGSSYDSYSKEYQGNVAIPEEVTYMNRTRKVTSIGRSAFIGCSGLTSVTIPNSVTSIGNNAFNGCSGLTSVTIPNSVTSIAYAAFYKCSGLTSVTIPNSVTSIAYAAFRECSRLTSITIPNSVTSIGSQAFYECYGLTSVTIPNSVTSIGAEAFEYCSKLTSVTIPNSVTSIGDYAFANCSGLTSVTIPNSVTSIGNYAFVGCSGLTSITIGSGVTSIGNRAFQGADIPTVISLIENPFTITGKTSDNSSFSQNTFLNATLYVPKGTIDKYKATDGWKDFVFIEEGAGGGDTPETQKCATPTISYENGKLTFSCETDGVKFKYDIQANGSTSGEGNILDITPSYTVKVFATKDGFEDSDVATETIKIIKGDVNDDGEVDIADAVKIVNLVVGKIDALSRPAKEMKDEKEPQ